MKKIYFLILILSLTEKDLSAQITGDTAVCAGNFYTYSANIFGADSFHWTTPVGWYNLQGQGTNQITDNCNVNAGDVCVEGFDSLGVSLGITCLTTTWGGGGQGWDVQPSTFTFCPSIIQTNYNPSQSIQIVPNGTGGNCGNCGGIANTKLAYCVYSGNTFIGYPNGNPITFYGYGYPSTVNWHVEYVDTSKGLNLPNAVIIQSGCGGSGNNSIQGTALFNMVMFSTSPGPPCVGSHFFIDCSNCFPNAGYSIDYGLVFANPGMIVTAPNWGVTFHGTISGCPIVPTSISGSAVNCSTPIIGDSVVCPGYRYTYTHPILNGYSGVWIFPPGWYDITGQGTSTLSATCNTNVGNIAFVLSQPPYGTFDTIYKTINFSGVYGSDVYPNHINSCNSDSFTVQVIPNGTGGGGSCPVGCGNGVHHPNIVYAVYDSVWPYGNFIGVADGASPVPFFTGSQSYYVYEVDTSNGVNSPSIILISGGCNVGTINNVIIHDTLPPLPSLTFNPLSVCLDSIITITNTDNLVNRQWAINGGIIIADSGNYIIVQPTNLICSVSFSGSDTSGCTLSGAFNIDVNFCDTISLTGSNNICAGNIYTYDAHIHKALTYTWQLPFGWYDIAGQGTSHLTATANVNSGPITVVGYDSAGYALDSLSINTSFKLCQNTFVSPSIIKTCKTDSIKATVSAGSFGTGTCLLTCSGITHPNVSYAVYDDVWPNGTFRGFADSIQNISPLSASKQLDVYLVDYTNGTDASNAILITGDCGVCSFLNIISIDTMPLTTTITKTPALACVGDTITLTEDNNALNPYWDNAIDLILLNQNTNPITAIITDTNPSVNFSGFGASSGCPVQETMNITLQQQCFYPIALFSSNVSTFCENTCVDFYDFTSNNPTSWHWYFPNATPDTSNDQNPTNICYNNYGAFDVILVACNQYSCDSITFTNYITCYQSPADTIWGFNDTLFSSSAFSYQWYEVDSGLFAGAVNSFFVPQFSGSYYCLIADTNDCVASSNVISVSALALQSYDNDFHFGIYPNPVTNNSLHIGYLLPQNKTGVFQIYDITGKIVFKYNLPEWSNEQQITLPQLADGVYSATFISDNKRVSKTIAIIKQ